MRIVEKDASHDSTNNEALQKVVEKWLVRTPRDKRTWQTLLEVAEVLDEHNLSDYLKKNKILSEYIVYVAV